MRTLEDTSLTPAERRVLERVVTLLEEEFGGDLQAIWLYGSRARGEPRQPESDVDLLIVSSRNTRDDHLRIDRCIDCAAEAEGANPFDFSFHVYEPERLAQRREIRSFFIQEVDRDKIVLYGAA
jgi:predicted nucleotidyltransferase